MEISLKTGIQQSQKLALTRSLKQAIELLQLTNVELYDRISSELVENPVIEEDSSLASAPVPVESEMITGVARNLTGDDEGLYRGEESGRGYEDSSDTGYDGEGDEEKKKLRGKCRGP